MFPLRIRIASWLHFVGISTSSRRWRLLKLAAVLKPVEEMPYVIPGTFAEGMQIGYSGVVQVTLEGLEGFPFTKMSTWRGVISPF